MAKYVSNKFKELQIGLSDYSESKTSLDVVGSAVIGGITTISPSGINVTGVITASSFSGAPGTGIVGDDIISRNLKITGVSTLGVSTFTGAVSFGSSALFGDNDKILLGNGGTEFQVYHDGATSIIKSGEGNLNLQTATGEVVLGNTAGEVGVSYKHNDRVLLRYDNSDRFQTTGYGVSITGITSTTDLYVTGISSVGSAITMYGSSGIVSATKYYGDGSNLTGIDATALKDDNKDVRVQANTSGAFVTGIITATSFVGNGAGLTDVSIAGISPSATTEFTDLDLSGNLKVTGLSTFSSAVDIDADLDVDGHTELDDVNVSGALTATTIVGTSLTISGISTLGNVKFETAGIVTSVSGIVTYYGDGQHLTGVATALNGNAVATTLKVSGLSTFLDNLEVSGTISPVAGMGLTYYGDGSNLTGVDADTIGDLSKLKVVGLSTFAGITTVTDGTFFADTVSVSGATLLGKGASGSVEIYDSNNLKLKTTGLGISIASGTAKTAYIEGPEEIWIDPSPVGVGETSGVVRIKGDLYVDGTNFIVDSETITLGDHKVGIASTVSDNILLDGGGIGIGSANIEKTLTWNNASTSLKSSENLNVASGKVYQIDQIEVLSSDTLSVGTGATVHSPGSNIITLGTNNTEKLRLDSDGKLLLRSGAHSSNINAGGFHNAFQVEGTDAPTSSIAIVRNSDDNNPAYLNFGKSRGTGIGSTTPVANDDPLGIIDFTGATGNETFNSFANIRAYADGIPSSGSPGSAPGRLTFFTGLAGDTNPQERLRITSDGYVGIGTTNPQADLQVGTGVTVYGNSGIVSATKYYGDGSDLDHLVVTGISTLGNVKFETAGIVTAVSGILTYYGDGQNLTGIATALNGNAVATNLNVSGVSTFEGAVGFGTTSTYPDHAAIYFGDDNDLQIFHSGSHSWIEDTGTGNLVLKGSRIDIQDTSGNELLSAEGGQYVRLGYGATERLKTTDVGVAVSGIVTASSGIVTYYGDGSKLTNVLKIEDEGSSVGSSATTINFVGDGVSAIYSNGISTVTIETTPADSSKWVTTDVGIHTLSNVGLGTTNPQTSLQVGDIYGVESGIGTWTAAAGIAHTINQYTIATNDFKTAEYTVHIGIGTKIQSQKMLVMQDGSNAYSQEYAVMYSNDLLVSIGSTVESGVVKIHATPDTGISGLTTYRFSRQTML